MSGHRPPASRLRAPVLALALALAAPAWADGPSLPPDPEPRRRSGVIETWPQLDHHYRDDMADPSWRRYGESYPYSLGEERPGDVRRGIRRDVESSLDRPGERWVCDHWRNGCRPPQPWWAR